MSFLYLMKHYILGIYEKVHQMKINMNNGKKNGVEAEFPQFFFDT